MGYRIIYGPDKVMAARNCGTLRFRTLLAISFGIFALSVRFLWPEGREVIAAAFLPGELSVTQTAFSELLENLRQGVGMGNSLTTFCRNILYEIT